MDKEYEKELEEIKEIIKEQGYPPEFAKMLYDGWVNEFEEKSIGVDIDKMNYDDVIDELKKYIKSENTLEAIKKFYPKATYLQPLKETLKTYIRYNKNKEDYNKRFEYYNKIDNIYVVKLIDECEWQPTYYTFADKKMAEIFSLAIDYENHFDGGDILDKIDRHYYKEKTGHRFLEDEIYYERNYLEIDQLAEYEYEDFEKYAKDNKKNIIRLDDAKLYSIETLEKIGYRDNDDWEL